MYNQPKDEKHYILEALGAEAPSYLAWNVFCSSCNEKLGESRNRIRHTNEY